jgi:hypothetical protein
MMNNNTSTTTAILLLATAIMLIGGLAVIPALELQQVEAGCEKGRVVTVAFNASQGRCFRG